MKHRKHDDEQIAAKREKFEWKDLKKTGSNMFLHENSCSTC